MIAIARSPRPMMVSVSITANHEPVKQGVQSTQPLLHCLRRQAQLLNMGATRTGWTERTSKVPRRASASGALSDGRAGASVSGRARSNMSRREGHD